MTPRRYQRGSVFLNKDVWKGMFRLDTPDGTRKQKKVTLGTRRELPNKTDARDKLAEFMKEMLKKPPPQSPEPAKSPKYSEIVERWKASEGVTLGHTTLAHYANALRSTVLPTLGDRTLDSIQREDITQLLNSQAKKYSLSSLRSMRLVMCMTLGWAEKNSLIQRPTGWLSAIRLPKKTGGRKVVRTELEPEQTRAIIAQLQEPYATLVLFLASVGRRIEEAIGVKPTDLDGDNILHIRRIIYSGRVEELEEEQVLPLDAPTHAELVLRLRALGEGHDWVFRSRKGKPINPGNALRRYLHPAAQAVGLRVGGFHDFRQHAGSQDASRWRKSSRCFRRCGSQESDAGSGGVRPGESWRDSRCAGGSEQAVVTQVVTR